MRLRIGSRESRLAVRQAELIIEELKRQDPDLETELVTMKTTGDRILNRTLDKIGGKGLFIKELDMALIEGRIDIAVHSLKDMPMEEPEEFPILAYARREDPRDVLILPKGAKTQDMERPVGCSSLRRKIQLQKLYPEVTVESIRGNVLTRLEKLDRGEYGALVLAAAGLKRLGLEERISRYFSASELLPSAGQGTLAVQGRRELKAYLACINDKETELVSRCERAFVRRLDGGCSSPAAAFGGILEKDGGVKSLRLRGLYARTASEEETAALKNGLACAEENGKNIFWKIGEKTIRLTDESVQMAEELGRRLADELRTEI